MRISRKESEIKQTIIFNQYLFIIQDRRQIFVVLDQVTS